MQVRVDSSEDFYESSYISDIDFEHRYQLKNFIKLNPWEKIKEIKFIFYKKDDLFFEMQLS